MKKEFINKVILRGCNSGSQLYKRQSGRDAEYRPLSMTSLKKGFTLIELLVVVLIIGILSAVALPQYEKAVEKSRMAEAFVMLNSIVKGMELYELQNEAAVSSGPGVSRNFYSLEDALSAAGMSCPNDSCNTKNFTYDTVNGDLALVGCGGDSAIATRVGKNYTLCYQRRNGGISKTCTYGNSAAQKICQSLGPDWNVTAGFLTIVPEIPY